MAECLVEMSELSREKINEYMNNILNKKRNNMVLMTPHIQYILDEWKDDIVIENVDGIKMLNGCCVFFDEGFDKSLDGLVYYILDKGYSVIIKSCVKPFEVNRYVCFVE